MTDPDWGPIFKKTKGIITNLGERTCHAAIVSRELGIPAIVGTGEATKVLRDGQEVTLSCAEGDEGFVYDGLLDFAEEKVSLKKLPKTRTPIMLNIASPSGAFRWWKLPCDGIGLARIEFIIANRIQVHPMALAHFDELDDREARRRIEKLTHSYKDKRDYFIDKLAQGIAPIAASQHPRPVIMRLSDFKTNEYAALVGGEQFESREQNPMLGLRGASRYYHEKFRDAFRLECEAIKRVRNEVGLKNVIVMVPFCRTLAEADKVLHLLADNGLVRGRGGLEIYMMCEIPSNVVLAEKFAERFDGFSIGSNDLTQLVLGVDRDSAELAELFDERNEAVKDVVREVIRAAHKKDRHRWSFEKLADCARSFANGLAKDGFKRGDHIVLFSENRPEWITVALGIIRAGAVVVPLDVQLGDKTLVHILRDSDARAVITTQKRVERIEKLASSEKKPKLILFDADSDDERSWERFLDNKTTELSTAGSSDEAIIFYTSGTTGPPKGVPLSHANIISQLDTAADVKILAGDDRVLLPLPLHHVYPFVIGMLVPLALGLPLVLPFSLSGQQLLRALREGEVTTIVGVPRLYSALYSSIESKVASSGWIARRTLNIFLIASGFVRKFGLRAGKLLFRSLHERFGQ